MKKSAEPLKVLLSVKEFFYTVMPNQLNTAVSVVHNEVTTTYFFSPKHRGAPTDEISIWQVNFDTELSCFFTTFSRGWHNNNNGWGFVSSNANELIALGRNNRSSELIIAKFVTDQVQWHGYPADIRHKPKDKPLPNILLQWFKGGFISKSLLVRIKQGQI